MTQPTAGVRPAGNAGKVVVTDDTFAELVLGSEVPVLVDFWASWCPALSHDLADPGRDRGRVRGTADGRHGRRGRTAQDDAGGHKVLGMPTLQLYRDGQLVGARGKSGLLGEFADVL